MIGVKHYMHLYQQSISHSTLDGYTPHHVAAISLVDDVPLLLFGHLVQLPLIRLQSLRDPIFKCQLASLGTIISPSSESLSKNIKGAHWTLSVNFLISSTTHLSLLPTSCSLSSISNCLSLSLSFFLRSRSCDLCETSSSSSPSS